MDSSSAEVVDSSPARIVQVVDSDYYPLLQLNYYPLLRVTWAGLPEVVKEWIVDGPGTSRLPNFSARLVFAATCFGDVLSKPQLVDRADQLKVSPVSFEQCCTVVQYVVL